MNNINTTYENAKSSQTLADVERECLLNNKSLQAFACKTIVNKYSETISSYASLINNAYETTKSQTEITSMQFARANDLLTSVNYDIAQATDDIVNANELVVHVNEDITRVNYELVYLNYELTKSTDDITYMNDDTAYANDEHAFANKEQANSVNALKYINIDILLIKKNPVLKKHVDRLITLIIELSKFKKIQEEDIKGIYVKKKKSKAELAVILYNLTGALRSFATDNKDDLLYNEIKKSKSDIKRLSDVDVVSYATLVIDKITKNQEALTNYGITAEELVNLTTKTSGFKELLLLPAQMRKEAKVATENIKIIISKILTLLRESIDNDMLQFADDKLELYKQYGVLREINDSQTTALSIKGTVADAHEPAHVLQYVKVTVKFKAGAELSDKVKSTTAKGNYQFKGLPECKCTITFEKNYYETLIIESEVHSDKLTKLDVQLKKIEKL